MRFKRTAGIVGVLVALALLAGCYNVPTDMTAIRIGGGLENSRPKGPCIKPGTRSNTPGNDSYVFFPVSEREWDGTGQKGSDGGKFDSVTKDSVEMRTPMTIRFTLITECKRLKQFYTKYARRYGVEFDQDGSYNKAWITLLRKLVKDPADAALDRIVQDYNWRAVWNDPKVKVEIEKRMNDEIDTLMQAQAHGTYFEGTSVLIGKPSPKNPELAKAVAAEQTNVAKARSQQAQAEADLAKAEAQIAVQKAEAQKKRADISAFGTVQQYNVNDCIHTPGCNPYPSPIIPGVR